MRGLLTLLTLTLGVAIAGGPSALPWAVPSALAQEEAIVDGLIGGGEGGAATEGDEAPAAPIEVDQDSGDDAAIERRLGNIFANVEGLEGVGVEVQAGVVTLSGEVIGQELNRQAIRLARAVEGVVEVEDRVEVSRDLERRVRPALERLSDAWRGFLGLLPVLAVALLILALTYLLARATRRAAPFYRRLTANGFLAELLGQVVRGVVWLGGLFLALLLLDATQIFGAVLGAAGILGLALSFALRDTVENYIASILLSLRQPFRPNDLVVVEGYEGRVVRLTSRATVLLTLDGHHVRVPNAAVFKGITVNYTENPARRFTFELGIAADEDLATVQRLTIDALGSTPDVLDDPPPLALYARVGDSSIILEASGWLDQNRSDFAKVRSEAIRRVISSLDDAGVDLPEPTIRLREGPPAPKAQGGGSAAGALKRAGKGEAPPVLDTSRDVDWDERVQHERTKQGEDLLDPKAPKE